MKTLLLSVVSLSIALAQVANAEEKNKDKDNPPKIRAKAPQAPRHVAPVGPRINQKMPSNQYRPRVQPTARIQPRITIPNANTPPVTVQSDPNLRNKNWQQRNWQNNPATTLPNRNWRRNNNPNTTLQNRNLRNGNNPNTVARARNWQNNNGWADARRRHHRDHHDRNWWRSHYNRFALFGTGYFFWDNGYWYPAYGYDPAYNTYDYNEPIYGYNDLEPSEVISNVQTELQRLGYYNDEVDGQMGPVTRAAIATYQRDNGLAITSAIDGPTLESLGLD